MNRSFNFLAVTLLAMLTFATAQGQTKKLSYDQLFNGGASNVYKPLPAIVKWLDDDHYLQNVQEVGANQLVSVEAKSGKQIPYIMPAGGDKQKSVILTQNDDLYLSPVTGAASRLTRVPGQEKNPTVSPDGKWVAFTRNNNLYAVEVSSGNEIQFTKDGSETIYNGYASWVYFEEILGRASRYKAFWWSPDSKHISFMRFDDAEVPVFPIYVADGTHGYLEKQRYPKAGDKNPAVRIGIVSVAAPAIVWSDFNEKTDQYFGTPVWTDGGNLLVQWMPRSQDNLKIYAVDLMNGSKKEIFDEKQKTWIDLDETQRIVVLPGEKNFIIRSDHTGWMHLYLYDMSGKMLNAITTGDYTVTGIESINNKTKTVYFTARKENSARTDFYQVGFDGKGLSRLTSGEFTYRVNPSPSVKYFIATYSNLASPPVTALYNGKGKLLRQLGDAKGAAFSDYALPKTELFRVPSADGLFNLPMTITYPADFDANRRYPVLINIYGGPGAGTVYDSSKPVSGITGWWAQEGIIQVAIDNRSSGHFGKMGMNYIYRQLGKYEIEDYMQCARWLKNKSFIDTAKICITGGSFGGYMTCMALTYGSSQFNFGVANSSVTDWRLYDSHYTERFMDTPEENPAGYQSTAVATYAASYRGLLRIVYGTSDDNVHMQNSMQLINTMEDMKKHFECMVYPAERHSIGANNPAKGLHNRLEAYNFFYKNLLNKPMPAIFWK